MACVLLVEDTHDCAIPLTRLLRLEGHGVEWAENGQLALDRLAGGFIPDLIILDLMMPVMDGRTFLRMLRAQPRWKDLRVVIFTASSTVNLQEMAELGVMEVYLKGSQCLDRVKELFGRTAAAEAGTVAGTFN